jgi:drug/metabolite transporter (DMT)-like permease
MEWLPLTLLCAFVLATSDALAKLWLQGFSAREMTLIRFSLSGLLLTPLILHLPLDEAPLAFWGWMAVLALAEVAAMLLYMSAIRDYPLSTTLPYLSFTPIFAILTGQLFLDERVSVAGLGGILLITLGAWTLNLHLFDRLRPTTLLSPLLEMWRNRGSRMMLGVAFIYSLSLSGSKAVMQYLPPSASFGALYFSLVGLTALLIIGGSRPSTLTAFWRRPVPGLVVAVLMAVMVITHFMAIQRIEAAYMVAVKRTSLLFGILYGAWLFKEEGLSRNLPASLLMVAGVAVILMT